MNNEILIIILTKEKAPLPPKPVTKCKQNALLTQQSTVPGSFCFVAPADDFICLPQLKM